MTDTRDMPAFPIAFQEHDASGMPLTEMYTHGGMTMREYAAIKLRVPGCGEEWLDEMIKQSLRDEFAEKALQGLLGDHSYEKPIDELVNWSYRIADAMLAERGEQK